MKTEEKSMYNLTPNEQETIINYNNGKKSAEVYTCDKRLIKKLSALAEEFPEVYRLKAEDEYSKTYLISDKKYIKFRKPYLRNNNTENREVIEAKMKAMRDREINF